GGQSMEKLVESKLLSAAIDVSTTEIADEIVGGVLTAGPARMDVFARMRVPYVGSCGALDMVNFWAMDTVPPQFRGRRLHRHNPNVTLMRTTPEENARIGRFIAAKLNRMDGPVRFLIPEGGVSGLDTPDGPFWDPAADRALFDAIASNFLVNSSRKLIRLPLHINDPQFAAALAANFREIEGKEGPAAWPASRASRS
ncbi:MAG TPA: Tm-1-like ATP-binding domain-containing protein, partial [Kiritimatiellia bacterium]